MLLLLLSPCHNRALFTWNGSVRPSSTVSLTHTLSDFDFDLPAHLIAQQPAAQRSASRLLDARHSPPVDRIFRELPDLLQGGDLLVMNDTRVLKARLFGEKPTGGKLELLLERVLGGNQVAAHMRVSKKPEIGATVALQSASGQADGLCATLLGRWPDADGPLFRFVLSNNTGDDPFTLMERHGHMPLPPYIERQQQGDNADAAQDAERYQTVFAKAPGPLRRCILTRPYWRNCKHAAYAAPMSRCTWVPELSSR